LSIVEEYLESPAQMLDALDNRYRGATTTDIIVSLSEIQNKVFSEENDMNKFLYEMGSLFANLEAMKCGLQISFKLAYSWQRFRKQARSMRQQLH
jgi:hypothetical protein